MEHDLQNTIALLTRFPAALDVLMRDLPEWWTTRDEGEKTWTASQVVGHLVHCERADWMPRVRTMLEFGESRAFEPLDRGAHLRENAGKPLADLLDEFGRLRSGNLIELRALDLGEKELALRGRHPAFGPVTLSHLLATWAAHDLNHLHQISRIMAHQYRAAVGPWRRYLGVMHCDGHSEPA